MNGGYSDFYAKFHPSDPSHRNGLRLLHQRILAPHLPTGRDAPILDVGCGRGYAIEDVQALGYQDVRGIDVDEHQAAWARSRGLAVERVARTEDYLQARTAAFAAVLLMDVLEHVPRPEQLSFLSSIQRSLRPNGKLICSVPNAASSIAPYWLYNDYTHQHSYTADSLSFVLEQAGFAQVQFSGVELAVRPRFLFWLPTRRTLRWLFVRQARWRRRLEYIGELGWERGRSIILTPNLLATAIRPPA